MRGRAGWGGSIGWGGFPVGENNTELGPDTDPIPEKIPEPISGPELEPLPECGPFGPGPDSDPVWRGVTLEHVFSREIAGGILLGMLLETFRGEL